MANEKAYIGKVTAYLPPKGKAEKGRSKQIGFAYQDNLTGDISFVIDTLPIPTSNWGGWCNIRLAENDKRQANNGDTGKQSSFDEDEPF